VTIALTESSQRPAVVLTRTRPSQPSPMSRIILLLFSHLVHMSRSRIIMLLFSQLVLTSPSRIIFVLRFTICSVQIRPVAVGHCQRNTRVAPRPRAHQINTRFHQTIGADFSLFLFFFVLFDFHINSIILNYHHYDHIPTTTTAAIAYPLSQPPQS
jgi:hypothetical protein